MGRYARKNFHFSLSKGDIQNIDAPLVRVQTQSVLQDTLAINDLERSGQLGIPEKISKSEAGVFVLINHRDASSYWLSLLEGKELTKKQKSYWSRISNFKRSGLTKIKVLGKLNIIIFLDLTLK